MTSPKGRVPPATFTAADRSSGDGMQTRIWGPSAWFLLHCIATNYPVKASVAQRRAHANFLLSLQRVLPCRYCRDNFMPNLRTALWRSQAEEPRRMSAKRFRSMPLYRHGVFDTREAFFEFIYTFHECVSTSIGKEGYAAPALEDVREQYEGFRSRCLSSEEQVKVVGEKGCTEPLVGKKGQCEIRIVPHSKSSKSSIRVDAECQCRRAE
jgi:hypothetical protein